MTPQTPEPTVVTAGAALFADELVRQGVATIDVDWRPPVNGTEDALATVMLDARRITANQKALARMLSARAQLTDVRPASEALALQPG